MVDIKHLENCINSLRKCVVRKKPKVVLDASKIDDLQFKIAITKVNQAFKAKIIDDKEFIKALRMEGGWSLQ